MRGVTLALTVVCLTVASLARPQTDDELDEEFYQKIFDDVDVDSIIDNDRVLDFYLKCFFDEGTCSDLAASMKKGIPEVFSTVCGKCSDAQKRIFTHSLRKFIPKRPKDWEKMLSIYDPKGEYWPKIQEFLKQQPEGV